MAGQSFSGFVVDPVDVKEVAQFIMRTDDATRLAIGLRDSYDPV